ncbi:MAG: DUF1772 domain-containing protein [Acidobacteriota bacterium]|nr:DUF1772 domain-containing protein [Acidobacteriota bacterium]
MRKQIAAFLLITSAFLWGTWFGGQYFNEARVIPKWLSTPPESIIAYNAIPAAAGGLPFFFPLNPLIFLVSLAAAIAGWRWARRSRKWLALAAIIGFGVCLSVILYLAPLIGGISAEAATLPAAEIVSRVETWKFGNRIRLAAESAGFICSVIALRAWSEEAAENG